MSRLVRLLGVVALVVFTMIPPSTQHLGRERCWPTRDKCNYASAYGTHSTKEYCHLRCMCMGYKAGYCWLSTDCRDPQLPWQCRCMGESEFHKWAVCGEP